MRRCPGLAQETTASQIMETWRHLLNFLFLMGKLALMDVGSDYGTASGSGKMQVDMIFLVCFEWIIHALAKRHYMTTLLNLSRPCLLTLDSILLHVCSVVDLFQLLVIHLMLHLHCGVLISQTTQFQPASAQMSFHAGEIMIALKCYHSYVKAREFEMSIKVNHQVGVIN